MALSLSLPRAPAPLRAAAPPPPAPRMRAAPPPAPPRPVTSAPLLSGRAPRGGAQSWRWCRCCPGPAAPAPGTKGPEPAPAAGQGHPPRPFGDSAFSVSAEPPHRELPEVTPDRPAPRAVPPVSPALPAVCAHAVPVSLLSGALRGNFPFPGLEMGGGSRTAPRPEAGPAARLPHALRQPSRGCRGSGRAVPWGGTPPCSPRRGPRACPAVQGEHMSRGAQQPDMPLVFFYFFSSKRKKGRRRRKNKRAHPPAPLVS